jgi:hypothetical protein
MLKAASRCSPIAHSQALESCVMNATNEAKRKGHWVWVSWLLFHGNALFDIHQHLPSPKCHPTVPPLATSAASPDRPPVLCFLGQLCSQQVNDLSIPPPQQQQDKRGKKKPRLKVQHAVSASGSFLFLFVPSSSFFSFRLFWNKRNWGRCAKGGGEPQLAARISFFSASPMQTTRTVGDATLEPHAIYRPENRNIAPW